ncbi:MAG: glycosyltransferase [Gammaproteobacteria bacterium]
MVIICTAKIAGTTVGHVDHALAYAAGFQRLGHEVYVMEQVGRGRCVDEQGGEVPFDCWQGRRHFEQVARSYGIWPRCCLIYKRGETTYGMAFTQAIKVARRCDLLITRSGQFHKAKEIFGRVARRAFFDGNPGNTQLEFHEASADCDPLDRYDSLFTLGFNIGKAACPIPTDGLQWRPMPRPVDLAMWPVARRTEGERFTTISTWKGRSTMHWDGQDSGQKADNWLRFLELPERTAQGLEVALRLDSATEAQDREMFLAKGWHLSDPERLRSLNDYRDYIGGSRAEFSVAHNRYVKFRTGWFSDRSALYLASGKPALVQSTGLEDHLPVGRGLVTYSTLDEAAAGIDDINSNYAAHSRAARDIAVEYFDSDKVLASILEQVSHA